MSALGHKRTFAVQKGMSALPPKAHIQPLVLVVAVRRRLANENLGNAIVADKNIVPEQLIIRLYLHCHTANRARSRWRELSAHDGARIQPLLVPGPLRKTPYICCVSANVRFGPKADMIARQRKRRALAKLVVKSAPSLQNPIADMSMSA